MKTADRFLQAWRLRAGMPWLGTDIRLVDVGAHQGELFEALGRRLRIGFGIEALPHCERQTTRYSIHRGYFPAVKPETKEWDALSMFAVLEHIPRAQHVALADACFDLLRPGGRVVITVPSKWVDHILVVLRSVRLIDGMSLEEHFGFDVANTQAIFSPPRFKLRRHRRFQLGLNHLFVFEKQPLPPLEPPPGSVTPAAGAPAAPAPGA